MRHSPVFICLFSALFTEGIGTYQFKGFETHLSVQDFINADASLGTVGTPTVGQPWISPTKFEGDIDGVFFRSDGSVDRNAVKGVDSIWPRGVIPYTISTRFNVKDRAVIASAIKEFTEISCIRFTPRKAETDYVFIYPGDGCHSAVGKLGGQQQISLGTGCLIKGIVMHELMHTIGFFHEQSREDRDEYIRVVYENIIPGMDTQFRKYTLSDIQYLGASYDYGSIMHYGRWDFSKNYQPTIVPYEPSVEIGQRTHFSDTDIFKLNRLHNCPKDVSGSTIPVLPICQDTLSNCELMKSQGGCQVTWIVNRCLSTCGQCPMHHGSTMAHGTFFAKNPMNGGTFFARNRKSVPICKDNNGSCQYWRTNGHCGLGVYRTFMGEYCARSCNFC